ncbi:MAG: TIGR03960 family B12-binding radical SAM protein [Synergistaceae bacterium]|nr:TIGR03960 family B12-binding radical SAM protein [Synergistaceae bacterium]
MSFPEFDNPLWPLLAQVARPSRYSGSEWRFCRSGFEVDKDALRVCLAFPDVYEIGMSYYGFQILEPFLRSQGVFVDRVYCPWTDMERLLREKGLPLTSVETSLPLSDFDVLGFTLQHELSYTNILTMLDLGHIPLRSEDRSEEHPLILGGGPGAFVPEPVAPFIDLFCVGEGEPVLPRLLALLKETRGEKREERLAQCARLPGVFVPRFVRPVYDGQGVRFEARSGSVALPVRRQFVRNLEDAPVPDSMVVPSVGIVHDRASVELFRGCSRGCRFCQAGMTSRPVRERDPEAVTEAMLNLVCRTGWEEASLLSLASCDYSGIDRVIDELTPRLEERGVHLSLPSLRMDGFSVDLAARLQKVRRGGLTFAPEAGTQRLRDVINKGLTEENIFSCLRGAFSHGWDRIKLYFMMGLPTETEEDLDGILRLARDVVRLARKEGRKRISVAVSVAGFVPKAHTPFQWERQDTIEEFRAKGRYLRGQVRDKTLSLKYHEPEQSFLEGVLARGDRRLADALECAWRKGARFDNWSETFDLSLWLASFEECGINPEDYTRARRQEEFLPWDHIDAGVTKTFLWKEREASRAALLTPDCRLLCNACGMNCDSTPRLQPWNSGLSLSETVLSEVSLNGAPVQ